MKYDESDITARKIYVLLRYLGSPVTGFTPAAGELKLSLSGAAVANGAGTWTEIGSGLYSYTCTQAETQTLSYIHLIVAATGVDTFSWIEDIGYRIAINEGSGLSLRIPIFLQGVSGVVTGAAVSAESTISINGAAFAAGAGTFGEAGSGAYYYEATPAEVTVAGSIVVKTANAAVTYVYAQSIVDSTLNGTTAEGCGYLGAYFGACSTSSSTVVTPPTPIPAPIVPGDILYRDHVQEALDRLCEQFKAKTL